jgi:tetratricopeptide (TPR) repeat protein
MDPEFLPARRLLGAAHLLSGRTAEALAELESADALGDPDPVLLAWLAHAKAVTGAPREARALVARARALEGERYVSAYHLALAYVGLGSHDAAFDALEQAWLDRDPALGAMHVEPRIEPLRSHAKYAALVARLNLAASPS